MYGVVVAGVAVPLVVAVRHALAGGVVVVARARLVWRHLIRGSHYCSVSI